MRSVTLVELAQLCVDSIHWHSRNKLSGDPGLQVMLPEGNPRAKYRMLFARRDSRGRVTRCGPRGRIVRWGIPEGCDTCIFSSVQLLEWLVKQGVCEVGVKEREA